MTHVMAWTALFTTMCVFWAVGNPDYFKVAAPLLLVNVLAGLYYAISIVVMLVQKGVDRHAG